MTFKRSCFGYFVDLDTQMIADLQKKWGFLGQLVNYVLCKIVACNKSTELWFKFDGKPARFSIYEFAIIMGLAYIRDCLVWGNLYMRMSI